MEPIPRTEIWELRDRLSLYLKQVQEGRQIEVTNWGVIVLLVPAKRDQVEKNSWRWSKIQKMAGRTT